MSTQKRYEFKNERVVSTTKMFQRGKTVVPSEIRKRLNLKDGERVVWIEKDGNFYVRNASSFNL